MAALANCEQPLLSGDQNEDTKKELPAIGERQHLAATIIKNLR